ncbi:MAG TPA: glycosyltransferase family 2 protein [Terriglobales bacterium]|nr:glycosyltransferase family 2 protein [Terriglobales bacterium]
MKASSETWIVIPVHNRKPLTLACLASLARQTCSDFAVMVVDDGSTDGTSEAIQESFPQVHLICGSGDLWWTRATNLGVQHALEHGAIRVVTLNDDLECTPDCLQRLLEAADLHPEALLGCAACDIATGKLIHKGALVDWKSARFDCPVQPAGSDLLEVSHLPGRGMLVPARVFQKIGLFDAKGLPHYGADYDFSLRAKAAGFDIFCAADARICSHLQESGTTKLFAQRSLRNYLHHLFGMKGGGNLAVFTRLAWRHCPRRYLASFLVRGLAARLGGYPLAWVREWRH